MFHQTPEITDINPNFGPKIGGTLVTLSGKHLDAGGSRTVILGDRICPVERLLCQVMKFTVLTVTSHGLEILWDVSTTFLTTAF